jgi:hypothetical protein
MGVKAKTGLASKAKENEARLGQKFGISGDELNYTLTPPVTITANKSSESEEELMATLQKIYDLVEAEPGVNRELKNKIARLLAKFYNQEEPGFTDDEAYNAIVRDYQMVRDIPELSASKPRSQSKRSSSRRAPVNRRAASVMVPSKPAEAKAPTPPTLEDIMAGRPFSPADFSGSTPPVNGRQPRPRPQARPVNRNLPAVMPVAMPPMRRSSRPMMMGGMPGGGRMGFSFMGFPMGFARWGQRYGRPW